MPKAIKDWSLRRLQVKLIRIRRSLVRHAHAAKKRLPNARLVVYQECGHWPKVEKAAKFNRDVMRFFSED